MYLINSTHIYLEQVSDDQVKTLSDSNQFLAFHLLIVKIKCHLRVDYKYLKCHRKCTLNIPIKDKLNIFNIINLDIYKYMHY